VLVIDDETMILDAIKLILWGSDTNLIENAIRPFVVGRKNWLFSGSPRASRSGRSFLALISRSFRSWCFDAGYASSGNMNDIEFSLKPSPTEWEIVSLILASMLFNQPWTWSGNDQRIPNVVVLLTVMDICS